MTHIYVAGGIYKPSKLTYAGDPRTATFQLVSGVKIQGGYAGGDYHLMPGSPCINAGNNAAAVVFADTTTGAGTQTSVIVADSSRYAIDDEIEYDGDGVLRTVTGVYPDSGQVSFDDPLAVPSEPNAPIGDYGWGDMDGDDRILGYAVDMGADEYAGALLPPSRPALAATDAPPNGTWPKTQNNFLSLSFDMPIALPGGDPLSIAELGDPSNDVSGAFTYQMDPDDPNGQTLKAAEKGAMLTNQTWYHIVPAAAFDVLLFEVDVCTLTGDADGSGRVTAADYSVVKAHLGDVAPAKP